jgi:predicted Zn-dependent protease
MDRRPHPLAFLRAVGCTVLLITSAWAGVLESSEPTRERTVLLSAEDDSTESGPSSRRKRTVLLTELDDERVGRQAASEVAADLGVLEDPDLTAYVQRLGEKLLRGLPRRSFRYRFAIVDQTEPNAFALPGGYIFISRGLLALVNREDELANVIGHEITHSARRHAAAQQQIVESGSPLVMPLLRAANIAAYARDMERTADRGGQQLAAAAGYDPMGMSTFLGNLEQGERLMIGHPRVPTFLDTHPGSQERAAVNAVRASELRWERDPALGDTRASYLRRIDGLDLGERPQGGVFRKERFLHPDLDFQIRFPRGWETSNTNRVVGAKSPRGEAIVFLETGPPADDAQAAAERFIQESKKKYRFVVEASQAIALGGRDAWRIQLTVSGRGGLLDAYVAFIPYREATWRITGVSPVRLSQNFRGRILNTMRSFRPLTPEQRDTIRATRLRLVEAQAGESLLELNRRTGNVWDSSQTAVGNGLIRDHRFEGGELLKIARSEPYIPQTP